MLADEGEVVKRVIVESPLGAQTPEGFRRNIRYAQLCVLDCLRRGEAPFASHLLYPQVLDDRMTGERKAGIEAGFAWHEVAELCVVYEDLGHSAGMLQGVSSASLSGIPIEYRRLSPDLRGRIDEDPSLWETLR